MIPERRLFSPHDQALPMACRLQNETTHCEFLYKTRVTPAVSIPQRYSFTEEDRKAMMSAENKFGLYIFWCKDRFTFSFFLVALLLLRVLLHQMASCMSETGGGPSIMVLSDCPGRNIYNILPLFSFPKALALLFFAKEFFIFIKNGSVSIGRAMAWINEVLVFNIDQYLCCR